MKKAEAEPAPVQKEEAPKPKKEEAPKPKPAAAKAATPSKTAKKDAAQAAEKAAAKLEEVNNDIQAVDDDIVQDLYGKEHLNIVFMGHVGK